MRIESSTAKTLLSAACVAIDVGSAMSLTLRQPASRRQIREMNTFFIFVSNFAC
jgi:hypothetical protein